MLDIFPTHGLNPLSYNNAPLAFYALLQRQFNYIINTNWQISVAIDDVLVPWVEVPWTANCLSSIVFYSDRALGSSVPRLDMFLTDSWDPVVRNATSTLVTTYFL